MEDLNIATHIKNIMTIDDNLKLCIELRNWFGCFVDSAINNEFEKSENLVYAAEYTNMSRELDSDEFSNFLDGYNFDRDAEVRIEFDDDSSMLVQRHGRPANRITYTVDSDNNRHIPSYAESCSVIINHLRMIGDDFQARCLVGILQQLDEYLVADVDRTDYDEDDENRFTLEVDFLDDSYLSVTLDKKGRYSAYYNLDKWGENTQLFDPDEYDPEEDADYDEDAEDDE